MLGVESAVQPEFGFKPRTPLTTSNCDNTEIDMRLGELLVEAKLTESDFQSARLGLIARYRDLESMFDLRSFHLETVDILAISSSVELGPPMRPVAHLLFCVTAAGPTSSSPGTASCGPSALSSFDTARNCSRGKSCQ